MAATERNPLGSRTVPQAATVVRARYWLNAVFRLIGAFVVVSTVGSAAAFVISQLVYTIAGVGNLPSLLGIITDLFTVGIGGLIWATIGAVLLFKPALVTSRLLPIPLPVCPICGYRSTGLRPGAPCPECGCALPIDADAPAPRTAPQQPRA